MPIVASGLVEQPKLIERVSQMQESFANDPDIARIEYRFGNDWSGDYSLFLDIVLKRQNPNAATIRRLNEQISAALLDVVRSEEFGMHSYPSFVSPSENGQ